MWFWGIFLAIVVALFLIGVLKTTLGIVEPRSGYTSEWCERYLGRIKVGGESFTGRFVENVHGCDSYLIMTRNDDLDPPYQVVRTIMCPDCENIVLPLTGCGCQLSISKTPKPCPIFKESLPGSLTHEWFAGYPEKKAAVA